MHRLKLIGIQLLVCTSLVVQAVPLKRAQPTQTGVEQQEDNDGSYATYTRAYPIALINQETIDKHHQELVQELKLNTLARYGVKAATAALIIYMAYEIWSARAEHRPYGASASEGELKTLTDEQLTAGHYAFQAHLQENYPQRFSWQWFKNSATSIGWSVFNIAVAKGVFDRGERLIDSVMHEGNLDWFVKTHTRSLETLVELTEYAHNHDAPGVNAREHAHHKEQIMHVTQSFINHMTAILGFMSYSKSVAVDPQVRLQMHTLMEYFRITCNEFTQSVTHALEQNRAVTPHISKMSVELNRLLMSFMRLEREQVVA
jgi:hypothetical protein